MKTELKGRVVNHRSQDGSGLAVETKPWGLIELKGYLDGKGFKAGDRVTITVETYETRPADEPKANGGPSAPDEKRGR